MPDMNMQTFEELQRHQLVTEFDIQSQSELDDYQVKLDNVSNPTQAQDNLVVGVDGESLSHWNENVDFDTWVKMQIGVSGKRVMLIHGNDDLSSGSSGSDVFPIFFDDASDGDMSDWTDTGQSGRVTLSSGIYRNTPYSFEHNTAVTYGSAYKSFTAQTGIFIFECDMYIQSDNSAIIIGNGTLQNEFSGASISAYSGNITYYNDAGVQNLQARTTSQWYHIKWIINQTTQNVKIYVDEILKYNDDMRGSATFSTVHFGVHTAAGLMNYDNLLLRKYTVTEPTYTIGTPKNIQTALKTFGRTG